MDVPSCAMICGQGTVNCRIMDKCDACKRLAPNCCKGQRRRQTRPIAQSGVYSRTNIFYQSDCDSDILDQCRQYRSSAARSRYVSVYAAICLLLLAAGLLPKCSAAPARKMSYNVSFWENPCDHAEPSSKSNKKYTPAMATDVVSEANRTLNIMASYQDEFANKTHTVESYKDLLTYWETYDWFRAFPWFEDVLLPRNPGDRGTIVEELVSTNENIDAVLPKMYRGLQMALASFQEMTKFYVSDYYSDLPNNLKETSHQIKFMLCQFYDVMRSRGLLEKVEPLDLSEIPLFQQGDKEREVLLVFRDSQHYVEYLRQVFTRLSEMPLES